jgi:F-type H+-transporting ATPase subunit gamma
VAKLLELRQRIRAVENIQTITRTLATVAAAKLARTRRRAAGLREYAARLRGVLREQEPLLAAAGQGVGRLSELLRERGPVRNVALLVLTADRGMCGGYNLEICRLAVEFWQARSKARQGVRFVVKGRKGARHLARRGAEILHGESWRREGVGPEDVERLLGVLLAPYRSRAVDEVWAAYTEFHSAIHRQPRIVRMLPVELPREPPASGAGPTPSWHHEPSAPALLDELVDVYVRAQLCDVLLESYASEQGARMITMEEATARAETALQEYRVQHNRLRREAITIDLLGALFASKAVGEADVAPGRSD